MDQIIRIEDDEGVVLLFLGQHLREHPVQGIALADLFLIGPHFDDGPVFTADVGRMVRAVIGDDVDVIHILRIVELLQVVDELPDDFFFVMRANNGSEGILRHYRNAFPPLHEAEAGQDEIIQGIKNDDDLYGYHDDIQDVFHMRLSLKT